jgi:hypothetical protein
VSETRSVAETVAHALAGVDLAEVQRQYWAQGEFVYLERWLPASLIERLLVEVERVRPSVNRNYIPRHKKGGSVSFYTLLEQAPTIVALYRAPAFVRFLAAVTGRSLQACPPGDPHSCALYFYTEPGDHIGFHFDTSYYRGARYTVLVGLVERSSSRLVCQLHKNDPARAPVELRLATHPGTLILFNGDTLWHAVTPLGEGEERVSLTLEYVTDPSMNPMKRLFSNLKDAVAYFGFRAVFRPPVRV